MKTFKSRNWTPSKNEWPSISLSVNSIYHHFSFVFVRACDELIHKIKAKREKEEEKKKNFIPQHTEKRSNVCLPLTKMLFYVLEKELLLDCIVFSSKFIITLIGIKKSIECRCPLLMIVTCRRHIQVSLLNVFLT